MNYAAILNEAHEAARQAQAGMKKDPIALDCGFAWVLIDGNDPLARYCRAEIKRLGRKLNPPQELGCKGYPRGWQFWGPGNAPVQAVGIHEAGARAFRDALAYHGIRADVGSRLD